MQLITDAISSTRLGKPKTFRNLTIFPVFGKVIVPDYVTLDEALTNKFAKVIPLYFGVSSFINEDSCSNFHRWLKRMKTGMRAPTRAHAVQ